MQFLNRDFEVYQAKQSIFISPFLIFMFYNVDSGAHSITQRYEILGVIQKPLD